MRKTRNLTIVAGAAVLGLLASACSSSSSGGGSGSSWNAATTSITNVSSATGGTLTYESYSDFESLDTGNTYFAADWNFERLYARTLVSFQQKPGSAGLQLVPDLATSLGQVSSDGLTWTYHIQPNAKFQDGSTITSADVKYAIERSNWGQDTLTQGPSYFKQYVVDKTSYAGPYKDKNAADNVSGIETPNATTIVFHLTQKFADFDYLATLLDTAPVPRAKDTGATYYNTYDASGQYEIQSYSPGKQLVLVKNPAFTAASDPNGLHKVLATKIVAKLKQSQVSIDNDILTGKADIDLAGIGVDASDQGKIQSNAKYKAMADSAPTGFVDFLEMNAQIKPWDNVDCRKAVEWVIDKQAMVNAVGGTVNGGVAATTVLPSNNTGYVKQDIYATPNNSGDVTKAKAELATCAKADPTYFNANGTPKTGYVLTTYSNNAHDAAMADVAQRNLASIGVNVTIDTFPSSTYYGSYTGNPTYAKNHNVAFSIEGWGADYPTGSGFMYILLTKAGINTAGGSTNLNYWDNPQFDTYMSQALATTDATSRNALYAQADQYAMSQAATVPLVDLTALFVRGPNATNVTFTQAYGMYDYSIIGAK